MGFDGCGGGGVTGEGVKGERWGGGSSRPFAQTGTPGSSMDVCHCSLAVLHRGLQPLPRRCVSDPSFCSQILQVS